MKLIKLLFIISLLSFVMISYSDGKIAKNDSKKCINNSFVPKINICPFESEVTAEKAFYNYLFYLINDQKKKAKTNLEKIKKDEGFYHSSCKTGETFHVYSIFKYVIIYYCFDNVTQNYLQKEVIKLIKIEKEANVHSNNIFKLLPDDKKLLNSEKTENNLFGIGIFPEAYLASYRKE